MRSFNLFGGLMMALLLCIILGCGPDEGEEIPADLLVTINEFYAAVEAGDGETRIELFGDEAVMMPNHWTRVEGKEAIAEVIRSGSGWVFKIRDREVIDLDADDDLAYTVNSYDYTYHAEGTQPQWHRTKNVHIWKRDATGHWKLHVDIWNSDVPMESFSTE